MLGRIDANITSIGERLGKHSDRMDRHGEDDDEKFEEVHEKIAVHSTRITAQDVRAAKWVGGFVVVNIILIAWAKGYISFGG